MEPLFTHELLKNIIVHVHDIFGSTVHAAVTLPSIDSGFFDNPDIGELVKSIYNFAIAVVGFAVFIQFIHAGLLYLFSGGSGENIMKAKSILQNAVLGAILLLSSYLILKVINPDLLRTDILDLMKISEQIDKIEKYDPKCDIDPSSCREAKTPEEKQLQELGIDWGNQDVSGMSKNAYLSLSRLRASCGCLLEIITYDNSSGKEFISLQPSEAAFEYISENMDLIISEDINIGGTSVTRKIWVDSTGNIYTTYENDGWFINEEAALTVQIRN